MFRRLSLFRALSIVSLIVLTGPQALAQSQKEAITEQEFTPEVQEFPEDPGAGFIVMDEGLWQALSDQPQQEFEGAIRSLAKGDPRGAANNIRKAAAFTRLAGGHSLPATQRLLYGQLKDLMNLADAVQSGKATTRDQLAPTFARTLEALAEHHAARAEKFWASGKGRPTGKNLAEAAQDFHWTEAWGGVPSTPSRDAVVNDVATIAVELDEKTSLDRPDVTDKIVRLVTELEMYRAELSPPAE
jgi:hypothetical protein